MLTLMDSLDRLCSHCCLNEKCLFLACDDQCRDYKRLQAALNNTLVRTFNRYSDYLEFCIVAKKQGWVIKGGGYADNKWFLKLGAS